MMAEPLAERLTYVRHPDRPGEHRAPCPEATARPRDDPLPRASTPGQGAARGVS
jgi:hypothetical protein